MITQVSDTHVRNFVRSHLARHEFDSQRITLRVLHGSVSMSGELWHVGGRPATLDALQKLERDVRATTGVRYASFTFENWRRPANGQWQPVGAVPVMTPVARQPVSGREPVSSRDQVSSFVQPITMDELLQARFRNA
jgi:hypothetical protein